jgi:hypothetical protein
MAGSRPTAVLIFSVSWLLAMAGNAAPDVPQHANALQSCSPCHTCQRPTQARPCLRACPRHEMEKHLSPELGPDVVILSELENLYVPVRFDHHKHAVMAQMNGGCEACHHFTPPNSSHPACKDCHPVEIVHEDIAQPGLKGAYHRACLHCHQEWDRDTACEVCHEKKKGGPLEGTATGVCDHSHYQPLQLDELIVFGPADASVGSVPFHHRNHSQLYERDCTECHQRQSCSRCHDEERCDACHGRDPADLFNHADTGWPLKAYHTSLECRSCHGRTGAFRKLDPKCASCHPEGWPAKTFDHRITGVVLDEVHGDADCDSCHTAGPGSTPRCDACHDDGRSYDAARGFKAS